MLNIYNRKEEFKNIQKEYQNIFAYKWVQQDNFIFGKYL
jgi:hypothetical protein